MDDPMIWSRLDQIRNVAFEGSRTQAGALSSFLLPSQTRLFRSALAPKSLESVNQHAVATPIHYPPNEAGEMFREACVLGVCVKIQTSSRSMGHTITTVTSQPDLDSRVPGAAL